MKRVIQSKKQVMDCLLEHRKEIQKYGAQKVGVFGSFVRNEQNLRSDLDLLVEFKVGQKTYDNFIDLSYFLEELFKMEIDLVTEGSLSPHIKPYILKEIEYVEIGD